MRVILLKDVKKVGKKGDILEVSDGYAKNFLLPQKAAVQATKGSMSVKKEQDDLAAANYEERKKEAQELAKKIEAINLTFYSKAGKDGRMFGTISTKQVVEELKTKHGIEIDKRKFVDNEPITAFGWSRLKNELFKGVIATVNVEVKELK